MEPWSDCEGAWTDLGLYCTYVLEDMFVPISWLFPWILSVFLWTLYCCSLTFLLLYLSLLLWPTTMFPSFQMFIYTISKYLSWLCRLQADSQDHETEILNQMVLVALYKLATWLPLMVRVCKSNIIFQSVWRPSICRSHKWHLLNH